VALALRFSMLYRCPVVNPGQPGIRFGFSLTPKGVVLSCLFFSPVVNILPACQTYLIVKCWFCMADCCEAKILFWLCICRVLSCCSQQVCSAQQMVASLPNMPHYQGLPHSVPANSTVKGVMTLSCICTAPSTSCNGCQVVVPVQRSSVTFDERRKLGKL